MYIVATKRRVRRGLGDDLPATSLLPSQVFAQMKAGAPPAPVDNSISTPGLLWNWLSNGFGVSGGCYPWDIACANRQAMINANTAQIQNVADRASYFYGQNSAPAIATQAVADYQKSQVPLDVNAILNSTAPAGPAGIPLWLWVIGGGIVLYGIAKAVS